MNINEIKALTGVEINRMTSEELREIAKDATRNVKQRLGQLKKAGIDSTAATRKLKKNWGSTELPTNNAIDSLEHNQLKQLVANSRTFLRGQTSTVKGERQRLRNFVSTTIDKRDYKYKKDIEKEITDRINRWGGYDELGKVFDLIEQMEEQNPSIISEVGTNPLTGNFFELVFDSYVDADFEELRGDAVAFTNKIMEVIDARKKLQGEKTKFK